MEEIWKPVVGYEGFYEVSSLGRIKSLGVNKDGNEAIRKLQTGSVGYLHCSLNKNGVEKTRTIHQIVAEAFLDHEPCGYKIEIDHINGVKTDNRVDNLRLVSVRFNSTFGFRNDKNKKTSKYPGVVFHKRQKKWNAQININGKRIHIGSFSSEVDAAEAYKNEYLKLEKNTI